MAGSHETNPVTKKHSSSKKHKSKSGKSSHKHSGKSGHRDEHRVEQQEHHETSGQTHGQTEQVQEQPGHSERVHEQPEQIEQQQAKRKGKKVHDWTKIYPSKHVKLSLISVVYLLYLIIIEIFYCACLLELV